MKKQFFKSLLLASVIIASSSCAQINSAKNKIFKSGKNACPGKKMEKHNCGKNNCASKNKK